MRAVLASVWLAVGCGRIGFTPVVGQVDADTLSRYEVAVLADGPIAYWRLDETQGIVAADVTGHHPGTYAGSPTLGVSGALASDADPAVLFGMPTDLLVIPDAPDLELDGDWSIELWAKFQSDSGAGFPALLGKGDSTPGNTGYLVYYHPDVVSGELLQPVFKRAGQDELYSSVPIAAAGFHHYVVTYDGTMVSWYVDGTPDTQYPVTFPPCTVTDELTFGGQSDGNNSNLVLDEIALYATALTASAIASHYQASL